MVSASLTEISRKRFPIDTETILVHLRVSVVANTANNNYTYREIYSYLMLSLTSYILLRCN